MRKAAKTAEGRRYSLEQLAERGIITDLLQKMFEGWDNKLPKSLNTTLIAFGKRRIDQRFVKVKEERRY